MDEDERRSKASSSRGQSRDRDDLEKGLAIETGFEKWVAIARHAGRSPETRTGRFPTSLALALEIEAEEGLLVTAAKDWSAAAGRRRVKTRRKKEGRPGFEEHVVTYDGQRLIWPWGEDRCGFDQVVAQADWLREFIDKRTGLRVDPKPILAFPGWFVKENSVGSFRVANHKLVPAIVRDWKPQSLTPEQIDLISRQLDERCCDVED